MLDDPRYLEIATRAANFLRANLYDEKSKLLYRNYREGRSDIEGFADDYAFVIQGLLDLYEASFDVEWLKFAIELQETQDRLFFDEKNGGYFSTSGKDESVFLRMKDDNDGAEPAASSVAALNLLRLSQIRNDQSMSERARKNDRCICDDAFAFSQRHAANAGCARLLVEQAATDRDRREEGCAGNESVAQEVHRHFLPKTILLLADGGEGQKYLGEKNEAIRAMSPVDGKPAAYVCREFHLQSARDRSKATCRIAETLSAIGISRSAKGAISCQPGGVAARIVSVPFRESTAVVENAPIRREQIKAIRRPGPKGACESSHASSLEARVVR